MKTLPLRTYYKITSHGYEIRHRIPLVGSWWVGVGLLSILFMTVLFWLSPAYVTKNEYGKDFASSTTSGDRTSNAVALRLPELTERNKAAQAEIAKELSGHVAGRHAPQSATGERAVESRKLGIQLLRLKTISGQGFT